jgi:Mn2+/Fe2+ NRAMP family transporter
MISATTKSFKKEISKRKLIVQETDRYYTIGVLYASMINVGFLISLFSKNYTNTLLASIVALSIIIGMILWILFWVSSNKYLKILQENPYVEPTTFVNPMNIDLNKY